MNKTDERSALLYHRPNDLAGAAGTVINIADHVLLPWEKRCHALLERLGVHPTKAGVTACVH